MNKLRENKGDFTIKGAIIFLSVAMLLVFTISVIGAVNTGTKLHNIADEVARYASIRGAIDSSVTNEQARIITASGIDCTVTYDADYIAGTRKIQFGESFVVHVECPTKFGIGGVVSVPITLHSKAEGRSEVYWKS